jgi:methyltransferase (TIGR00027 family)
MAARKQDSVTGVSDTALWIAALRAKEGARPDAVFRDPLAAILAGDRGKRIAQSIPRPAMVHWGVVARTSAIDRLIHEAIKTGVDTVINLGAGLDTRPYRMNLPSTLHWIELDFPDLIESKTDRLAGYVPVCRLDRAGLDLLDRPSRNRLLAHHTAGSERTLIITEGVIPYFSNQDVAWLAEDLRAIAVIQLWLQDFDNAGKLSMPIGWAKKLKTAPVLFEVQDWFDFFKKTGWQPCKIITNAEEAERIHRPYPLDFPYGLLMRGLPNEVSRKILSLSGSVLLHRP